MYGRFFDNSKPKLDERVVPIIESIIEDDNRLEHAINIPNNNFIEYLFSYLIVDELSLHFIFSALERLLILLLPGIK